MRIETAGLSKSYGPVEALKKIDLKADRPGVFAILGPNGSGKTTLIKCLLGMVIPEEGDIRIEGTPIVGTWEYRENLSYLPQIARFPDNLTARDLVRLLQNVRSTASPRLPELIADFGLENVLDKRLNTLSGGTKQKVGITLCFMFDVPLLILDEPTSGLDPLAMRVLRKWIDRFKSGGKTILVTSHIMDFVEDIADEVFFLVEGNLFIHESISGILERYGKNSLEEALAEIMSTYHEKNTGI